MAKWTMLNENPAGKNVGDCAVRAVSIALNTDWGDAYTKLALQGYIMGDMPSSNAVIGALLKQNGFKREAVPDTCPDCYTLGEFADDHPDGVYVVFMNHHVATVVNGTVLDAWNSMNETPIFYWRKE